MTEVLCPFDYLQVGPWLAVHASILLMIADWSGTDLRMITTRYPTWWHLKQKQNPKHYLEDFTSLCVCVCVCVCVRACVRARIRAG